MHTLVNMGKNGCIISSSGTKNASNNQERYVRRRFLWRPPHQTTCFFTGNGDCTASSPINFEQGAVVAIGECKTSNLILPSSKNTTPSDTVTPQVWHMEDVTVQDIILAHKPTLIKNIFCFPESNVLQGISWLGRKQCLATELEDQIKNTTKWYLQYYLDPEDETECRTDRTDMSIAANQAFVKCLT